MLKPEKRLLHNFMKQDFQAMFFLYFTVVVDSSNRICNLHGGHDHICIIFPTPKAQFSRKCLLIFHERMFMLCGYDIQLGKNIFSLKSLFT